MQTVTGIAPLGITLIDGTARLKDGRTVRGARVLEPRCARRRDRQMTAFCPRRHEQFDGFLADPDKGHESPENAADDLIAL
jgi:hypothetical protein